jgi:hypothetical protein
VSQFSPGVPLGFFSLALHTVFIFDDDISLKKVLKSLKPSSLNKVFPLKINSSITV